MSTLDIEGSHAGGRIGHHNDGVAEVDATMVYPEDGLSHENGKWRHVVSQVLWTAAAIIGIALFVVEYGLQLNPPVKLDAIWFVPNTVTVAEVLAQKKDDGVAHLHKTGSWERLCNVVMDQFWSDENGNNKSEVISHQVATPPVTGPMLDKARPIGVFVPILRAAEVKETGRPVTIQFTLDGNGDCWPGERLFKAFRIKGMRATTKLTIVP